MVRIHLGALDLIPFLELDFTNGPGTYDERCDLGGKKGGKNLVFALASVTSGTKAQSRSHLMAAKLNESRLDHDGSELPDGVYALVNPAGKITGYKTRWAEVDDLGRTRQRSKSFSISKHPSRQAARRAAEAKRAETRLIVRDGGTVLRDDPARALTFGGLFKSWITGHAAHEVGQRHAEKAVRYWDKFIEPALGDVRLGRLNDDPAIVVRFGESLHASGVAPGERAEALKILRAVLNWGRRRYPRSIPFIGGMIEIPSSKRRRLVSVVDAITTERLIEAIQARNARNPLLPIRDAAFAASMGFVVAARPSELLHSAWWESLFERTLELQGDDATDGHEPGLKTGARAALMLPNARLRIIAYRKALEAKYGPQPPRALIFQKLGPDGPLWGSDSRPIPWSLDDYNRWVARVWRPARRIASQADDAMDATSLPFYNLRHSAISTALHSTLVMTADGMNLHPLAAYAGHDVTTLQRYYAHQIARYRNEAPFDLEAECSQAMQHVLQNPFSRPADAPGPQRLAQQRRRARLRAPAAQQ